MGEEFTYTFIDGLYSNCIGHCLTPEIYLQTKTITLEKLEDIIRISLQDKGFDWNISELAKAVLRELKG